MSVLRFRQPVRNPRNGEGFRPHLVERLMAAVYRRENLPAILSRGEMLGHLTHAHWAW